MRFSSALTAVVAAAASTLLVPAPSRAQPPTQDTAPQPGASCPPAVDGALARVPGGVTLRCRGQFWQPLDDPYPFSDRWLSYGPELTLHGQGRRNPEIMSGPWVGSPRTDAAQCKAEQSAVVGVAEVGDPQVATGQPGQPLRFSIAPTMFTIELSGDCLWEKAG